MIMANKKSTIVDLNEKEFRELNRGRAVNLEITDNSGKPVFVRLNKDSLAVVRDVVRSANRLSWRKK
jgi:hypothetical protein